MDAAFDELQQILEGMLRSFGSIKAGQWLKEDLYAAMHHTLQGLVRGDTSNLDFSRVLLALPEMPCISSLSSLWQEGVAASEQGVVILCDTFNRTEVELVCQLAAWKLSPVSRPNFTLLYRSALPAEPMLRLTLLAAIRAPLFFILTVLMEMSPPMCCHSVLGGGHISKNSAINKNSDHEVMRCSA